MRTHNYNPGSTRKKKKKKILSINFDKLNTVVHKVDSVDIEKGDFLKLYLTKLLRDQQFFPIMGRKFLNDISNTISGKPKNDLLSNFYEKIYSKTLPESHVKPNKGGISKFLEYSLIFYLFKIKN